MRRSNWLALVLALGTASSGCSAIVSPNTGRLYDDANSGGIDSGPQPDVGRVDTGVRVDAGSDAPGCPADCSDDIACTEDACDGARCTHVANDALCPGERCNAGTGCVPVSSAWSSNVTTATCVTASRPASPAHPRRAVSQAQRWTATTESTAQQTTVTRCAAAPTAPMTRGARTASTARKRSANSEVDVGRAASTTPCAMSAAPQGPCVDRSRDVRAAT